MELMIFLAGAVLGGCVTVIIFALATANRDEGEE